MDKEKSEQIKIALLAVIAVLLIIKTVNTPSEADLRRSARIEQTAPAGTFINDMGGITVQGSPGAQVTPQITPQPVQPAREATSMTFDNINLEIGTVSVADNKTFTYNVTNTGLIPLTFSQITGDDGLTIISQPTAPIAPGAKGEINVQLTALVGTGPITKTIHVGANTEPSHLHLTLQGTVK